MSGTELIEIADELQSIVERFTATYDPRIGRVLEAASEVGKAWSGSNIGYQADVYYEGLQPRPAGAQFSTEWGLGDHWPIEATRGDWREYNRGAVRAAIFEQAGNPNLQPADQASATDAETFNRKRADVLSILSLVSEDDPFIRRIVSEVEKCRLHDVSELGRSMVPTGQFMTRDTLALGQGRRLAAHQSVIAEMWALNQPSLCAKELSSLARQAGSHLLRRERRTRREGATIGTNVFVGHGRASAWRELKDFLKDRLGLPYDEFNRVPVAGITNIARLAEMLDAAAIAFLVLTAEDELADGRQQARLNVIHEVGLFQGRLGFSKAIVLLEEGCEEFSNIQGLGQIRFPKDNIGAAFEEIRRVLEREGVLSDT